MDKLAVRDIRIGMSYYVTSSIRKNLGDMNIDLCFKKLEANIEIAEIDTILYESLMTKVASVLVNEHPQERLFTLLDIVYRRAKSNDYLYKLVSYLLCLGQTTSTRFYLFKFMRDKRIQEDVLIKFLSYNDFMRDAVFNRSLINDMLQEINESRYLFLISHILKKGKFIQDMPSTSRNFYTFMKIYDMSPSFLKTRIEELVGKARPSTSRSELERKIKELKDYNMEVV
jgi:hypothetical protein